jgi:hypothetical protein
VSTKGVIFRKSGSFVEQSQDETPKYDTECEKTKNVKQEIVIIGDSHARNCAAELQYFISFTSHSINLIQMWN